MLITSKGQIIFSKVFSKALGLLLHIDVEFERVGDELHIREAKESIRG